MKSENNMRRHERGEDRNATIDEMRTDYAGRYGRRDVLLPYHMYHTKMPRDQKKTRAKNRIEQDLRTRSCGIFTSSSDDEVDFKMVQSRFKGRSTILYCKLRIIFYYLIGNIYSNVFNIEQTNDDEVDFQIVLKRRRWEL